MSFCNGQSRKYFNQKLDMVTDMANTVMASMLESHTNILDYLSISILEAQVKAIFFGLFLLFFYYHFIISIVVIGITVRNLCVIFTFWLWSVQIARLFFFELGGQIGYQAFQILMTFFFFCTDIAGGVERSQWRPRWHSQSKQIKRKAVYFWLCIWPKFKSG